MTSSHQDKPSCQWFSRLASALDPRSAPRLARLLLGAVLARGRRTVTSWIRAVGLGGQFQPCYTTVAAAGKQADLASARLLQRRGQAAGRRPAADHPGPRRHADGAVRALRPGGRHPSQPDARPGRLAARLRPHLGRPGAAGGPPELGGDRPAAAGADVRPGHRPAGHRPEAPARVPDQAPAGRRAAAMGPDVAEVPGQADLGGGRRGLCQGRRSSSRRSAWG